LREKVKRRCRDEQPNRTMDQHDMLRVLGPKRRFRIERIYRRHPTYRFVFAQRVFFAA
jgi:hypothetical protein